MLRILSFCTGKHRALVLTGWLLMGCIPRVLAQQETNITIGTVSGQLNGSNAFAPFTDYLNARMPGQNFQVVGFPDIEALMASVDDQALDFSFITPAAFVDLNLDNDLRLLATVMQRAGDSYSPWLAGAVFTLASRTDINELADVRNQNVIALSEFALGGWLSAVREWQDLGLTQGTDYSVTFDFSYSSVIAKVCRGEIDVGVISASTLDSFLAECDQELKILPKPGNTQNISYPLVHSTRLYPEVAFAMIGQHEEAFVRELTRALLDIEADSDIALAVSIGGLTAPLSYSEVESLMQELGLDPFPPAAVLTISQLLTDNIYLVIATLLGIIILTSAGFINAHFLSLKFQESENFRKKMFDDSQMAMVVVDPFKRTYLDMNQAAVKLYGYQKKEELIGQSLNLLTADNQNIDGTIPEAFERVTKKVFDEGEHCFNWHHKRPNGEEWIGKIHLMILESNDGPLIQAVVEDVSEQMRIMEERGHLEQQLETSQRMESIGRLAGSIAHDFNNLLTIINGYSEYMLDDIEKDSAHHEILEQINKAGIRASELTQQLLTFSRKQVVKQALVDISEVISDSAGLMKSVLGEGIKLELDLRQDKGYVLSDQGQIQRIILNLVMNARDAMPDGGTLTIKTKSSFLTPQMAKGLELQVGEYLEITISDDGIGMDDNIARHIFEPFFTTKANAGTGLGLSTVYGIVRQSKGNIVVDSTRGKGTTFSIYLPETEGEVPLTEQESLTASPPDKDYTILVVEDQEEVRTYIVSVLLRAGYTALAVDSGSDALALMSTRNSPVDLLLTDVVMEGISGGELAQKLHEQYPETPVLYTSGYPADDLERHGVRQEAVEFLAKPFSPNELLARINQVLKSAKAGT